MKRHWWSELREMLARSWGDEDPPADPEILWFWRRFAQANKLLERTGEHVLSWEVRVEDREQGAIYALEVE